MARRWHHAVLTASALLPLGASALAGPNGANVVGGAATIQGQGTGNVVVNQSTQNAIVNWQTFNIGSGETTRIYMPNSSSTQLDRVIGRQGPSQILGTLTSNGKVFLVNPDGILFGMGARINVGSLVATTNDITNTDFMAGRYNFSIPGNPNASIVNLGTITAQTGGFAALVAPGVRNTGTITATLGTIALASGNAFTLDMYGDNLITLGLSDSVASQVIDVATGKPLKSLVSNEGKLKANGGTVVLTAVAARQIVDSVINNTGVIEANSIGSHNGKIVLGAATGARKPAGAPTQTVRLSGRLSAHSKRQGTRGGTIQITGENIEVSGATIDASGQAGGGTVLIGGDWGGGYPNTTLVSGNASATLQPYTVPNASTVSIDAGTTIDASGTGTGNGGKVIVWANQATTFLGTILAKGGTQSGNGGFVETSGGTLTYNGTVNTSAANGKTGTWLLDPTDLTIDAGGATTISNGLANNNVVVYTDANGNTSGQGTTSSGAGDIIVASAISWSSANTLTLDAYRSINIKNVAITNTGAGNLVLRADSTGTGTGTVTFSGDFGRINFSQSTGTVSIFYNSADNPPGSLVNPTSYTSSPPNFRVSTNGDVNDQFTTYMLVNTVYDLQNIQNNLSGAYALGKNIDASATANWNDGAGFVPIGNGGTSFIGTFNGQGNTINGLNIYSAAEYVGLFGYIGNSGAISNFSLTNSQIKTDGSSLFIGAVAGGNNGSISNVTVSGQVGNFTGNPPPDDAEGAYGGLVGLNDTNGTIAHSSSSAAVSVIGPTNYGYVDGGGLVGQNRGSITASFATGTINGSNSSSDQSYLGGLVGWNNSGQVSYSYATGSVTGSGSFIVAGGLIGTNDYDSAVAYSYATGNVTAAGDAGGLIGDNYSSVTQTYATGAVAGSGSVGGLVGFNSEDGTILQSYFDTTTSGIGSQHGIGSGASGDVTGLTTAKFGNKANFIGWQFGTTPGGPSCSDEGACWIIVDSDGSLNNASGTGATRPMLLSEWSTTITNPHQLQLVALDPSAHYTLANSIDLGPALSNRSDVWGPNGSAGFVPLGGNAAAAFTGSLNGNGNTISNLTINSASLAFVGLFGEIDSSASIQNLGLVGGSVSGGIMTGALAGANGGTLTNVYETGAVTAAGSASIIGGLVGVNFEGGTIAQSYATGPVTAGDTSSAGGLVGENFSAIFQSHATGTVTAGDTALAGGLVGVNFSTVSQSYATGAVTVDASGSAGGLIGATGLLTVDGNSAVNSITDSHATGAVTTGAFGTAGGLVGYNLIGTITQSYASGAVTVGANSLAGGLVGQNFTGASIANSYASGAVSSAGVNVELGGLVGGNDPGALIINSQAYGTVTSTASLPPQSTNNNCINVSCEYVNVGGFVGANYGTISGTVWTSPPTNCTSASTCASGNVAVGALGAGGGFAGYNEGIVQYAFATGNVTGAAGLPDTVAGNVFDNTTQLAGFVANNHGQIVHAFATGNVGSAGTMWLSAAGFAGDNEGTIDASFATGAVIAGDNSTAGGFVQSNAPDNNAGSCLFCFTGDAFNNSAAISNSQALGNVTVGAFSAAGGFATIAGNGQGLTGGSFTNVSASGAVNAGQDSIVGGLIAVLGEGGTIANSAAKNTIVASSGANSIVGGIAGVNEGTISDTSSTAPVSGTSDSYIGGVTGINLGLITGSSTDPAIGGSGGNNFVGGIAGLNVGSIDNSNGRVDLASGTPNYIGGVAGVNGAYGNSAGTILNSSFPIGTITNSSSSGTGFTNQVGATSPSFIPGLPSWLAGCTDAACTILIGGSLQQGTTPGNPPPSNPPPSNPPPGSPDSTPGNTISLANQQVLQFIQPNATPSNLAPPLVDPSTLNAASGGFTNGAPGNGGGTGSLGGSGNGGSLANGRQGGNGAPPGMRLIDMRVMPLPPGSGLPPPGETRFLSNQLVLQFGPNMTQQQIAALAQRFGLTIVSQQSVGSLGRTVYTFQIANGQTVPALIQAINTAGFNAAAQPNYSYALSQDLSGTTSSLGDPAQYIVQKLQLGPVHRITEGKDIVVALIDSRVDPKQPDLAGRVVDYYDAGCGANTPPDAHGTGMAGAIASHIGLLGVAPNAKIIAICAFGGSGGKPEATSVKIIRGLDYAIAHGAKVVNMSFAGPPDPALAQELQIAREKGILIVAAAGNAGPKSPPLYPGADPNVMAVTATDEHDRLFAGANQGSYITIAAPGVNILVPAPNGDVQFTTGTSVASANISGVAALLLAEKSTRTPEEIRAILVATARHLGAKGVNQQFGAGLVDPLKALRAPPPAPGRKPTAAATPLRLH